MFEEIVKALSGQAGVIALGIGIAIAGAAGKWVFGYVHREALAEKDRSYKETMAEKDRAHEALLKEKDAQLAEERARSKRWEEIAWRSINVSEKVVNDKAKVVSDER